MMTHDEITTILGQGSSFDGKLTFEGTVRIDGHFSGEIHTSGTLVIGETAEVEAQIQAATIVVQGKVRGDLRATASLEIHAPARVYGNLTTPSLTIQQGSVFQGACQMEDGPAAPPPVVNGQLAQEAPSAPAAEA